MALAGACVLSSGAFASVLINEVFVNPPGTDNGFEYFELIGNSNESLNGLTLLTIEGDGASAGTIDVALSLNGMSIGSNGLFLWRDASGNIPWIHPDTLAAQSGPSAGTSVHVADFNPDIENGSNSYMLVTGFTGQAGTTDVDTNNDGVLDSTPWSSVLDAVALIENDGASNFGYADDVGGFNFGPDAGFNADLLMRLRGGHGWFGSDVLSTTVGTDPFDIDGARFGTQFSQGAGFAAYADARTATPGGVNLLPEPSSVAVLALGAMAVIRRRRS